MAAVKWIIVADVVVEFREFKEGGVGAEIFQELSTGQDAAQEEVGRVYRWCVPFPASIQKEATGREGWCIFRVPDRE